MRKLFVILISIGYCSAFLAQTVEKVETIFASIEGSNQDVVIKWKSVNDTSQIIGYKIFEYVKTAAGPWGIESNNPIRTIHKSAPTMDTFQYADVETRPVKFVVYSYISDTSLGARYNISQTMYNTIKYDSCLSTLTLTWTQYYGWGTSESAQFRGNVREYRIFDANTSQMIGKTTDTTFLISQGIYANNTYQYYILAVNSLDTTIRAKSNIATKYTLTRQPPIYITTQSATYVNDSEVQITFTIDPGSEITDYILSRASSATGTYTRIDSFSNVVNQLVATDRAPLSTTAYYRLQDKNYCGVTTLYSDTSTAIVPVLYLSSGNVTLYWSSYIRWSGGVSSYNIERSFDGTNFSLLASISGSINFYNDNISSLTGQLSSGRIYYRIIAVANTTNYESVSKIVYIDLSTQIYVPNAFTPDGNGQNDKFQAYFAFPPTDYQLLIYNRYGAKVYETKDSSDDAGWNGMVGGKKAPEGVYVYLIYYSSGDEKKVEKKGNFTLIYP